MRLRKMLWVMVLTALGCGEETPTPAPPDTTMTTEGFDKTCSATADCVLVFTGNVCGCACTQEAIALGEQSRYSAEQEEKRKACTDDLVCQPCPDTQMAACASNKCNVVPK